MIPRSAILFAGAAIVATTLALPCGPSRAQTPAFNSVWQAGFSEYPDDTCSLYSLTSIGGSSPQLGGGELALDALAGSVLYYSHTGTLVLDVPDVWVLEARVKVTTGTVVLRVDLDGNTAFVAFLEPNRTAVNVGGFSVDVDNRDFHVYRVEVDDTSGQAELFRDGASVYKGASGTIVSGTDIVGVLWGDQSIDETSASRWTYVRHNAYPGQCGNPVATTATSWGAVKARF